MTRTGIYGGSFNPIHRGHVELAEFLCRNEGLDELWFMVSPQNPFKKSASDLSDEKIRLELARMAVRGRPCLKVSDFEFRLPRPSYTADTLAALRKAYPGRLFTLVIGADNWLAFKEWKRAEEILRRHRVLVCPRPGYPVEAASLPPGVRLADAPLIPLSSTEIRRLVSQGKDASPGLDPDVWRTIREKGYYRYATPSAVTGDGSRRTGFPGQSGTPGCEARDGS